MSQWTFKDVTVDNGTVHNDTVHNVTVNDQRCHSRQWNSAQCNKAQCNSAHWHNVFVFYVQMSQYVQLCIVHYPVQWHNSENCTFVATTSKALNATCIAHVIKEANKIFEQWSSLNKARKIFSADSNNQQWWLDDWKKPLAFCTFWRPICKRRKRLRTSAYSTMRASFFPLCTEKHCTRGYSTCCCSTRMIPPS